MRLPRVVSLWDSVAFIVGTVIGSGIFILPKGVLQLVGSPAAALGVWLVAAIVTLISSLTQIELGLTYPRIGSTYLYIREAFGETVSFIYCWTSYNFVIGTYIAVVAQTFGSYVTQMFFDTCAPPNILIKLTAALAIITLTAVHMRGTKFGIGITKFLTVSKLFGLLLVIFVGFYFVSTEKLAEANLTDFLDNASSDFGSYVMAYFIASWAYVGLAASVGIIEELKEPLKANILGSLFISVAVVTVVYFLANLSYLIVLSPSEIFSSYAVAMTLMNKVIPGFFWIMPFFVACSTLGAMNNAVMIQVRFGMAVARRHHLPNLFTLLSLEKQVPIPSLIFISVICLILLLSGGIFDLIIYVSFIQSIFNIIVNIGHIKLRLQQPNLVRPFRVHMVIIVLDMALAVVTAIFPILRRPLASLTCLAFIASGIPVYFVFIRPERAPKIFLKAERLLLHFCQKMFRTIPETFENASGKREK